VSGATARQLTEAFTGEDGVLSTKPFGASIHVRVRGALEDPARLLALAASRGLPSLHVEPASATLEDVFLELVGRSSNAQEGAR
jgi:hypothetical protein